MKINKFPHNRPNKLQSPISANDLDFISQTLNEMNDTEKTNKRNNIMKKSELKQMIREEIQRLNENVENAKEFSIKIKQIAKKYFKPNNYQLVAELDEYKGMPHFYINFALVPNQKVGSGYINNAPIRASFFIYGFEKDGSLNGKLEIDTQIIPQIMVDPYWDGVTTTTKIKIPFRKGINSYNDMLKKFDKLFSDMNKSVKSNKNMFSGKTGWVLKSIK